MIKKYKICSVAKEDLQRIYAYGFHRWGEQQAVKYFNDFFECFEKISQHPNVYQQVNHIKQGYSRCVCGVDNIYFRQVDGIVEIMTIIGN